MSQSQTISDYWNNAENVQSISIINRYPKDEVLEVSNNIALIISDSLEISMNSQGYSSVISYTLGLNYNWRVEPNHETNRFKIINVNNNDVSFMKYLDGNYQYSSESHLFSLTEDNSKWKIDNSYILYKDGEFDIDYESTTINNYLHKIKGKIIAGHLENESNNKVYLTYDNNLQSLYNNKLFWTTNDASAIDFIFVYDMRNVDLLGTKKTNRYSEAKISDGSNTEFKDGSIVYNDYKVIDPCGTIVVNDVITYAQSRITDASNVKRDSHKNYYYYDSNSNILTIADISYAKNYFNLEFEDNINYIKYIDICGNIEFNDGTYEYSNNSIKFKDPSHNYYFNDSKIIYNTGDERKATGEYSYKNDGSDNYILYSNGDYLDVSNNIKYCINGDISYNGISYNYNLNNTSIPIKASPNSYDIYISFLDMDGNYNYLTYRNASDSYISYDILTGTPDSSYIWKLHTQNDPLYVKIEHKDTNKAFDKFPIDINNNSYSNSYSNNYIKYTIEAYSEHYKWKNSDNEYLTSSSSNVNPIITFIRGYTYILDLSSSVGDGFETDFGHPINFQTTTSGIDTGNRYFTIQGGSTDQSEYDYGYISGQLTFTVPITAPNIIYYQCGKHPSMNGRINIINDNTTIKEQPNLLNISMDYITLQDASDSSFNIVFEDIRDINLIYFTTYMKIGNFGRNKTDFSWNISYPYYLKNKNYSSLDPDPSNIITYEEDKIYATRFTVELKQ